MFRMGEGILMISVDLYVYLWLRFANIQGYENKLFPTLLCLSVLLPWLTLSEARSVCPTL